MDALLKPDIGLIFWTVVNFAILVFLLAKFAWKPVISALEAREKKITDDVQSAQQAKDEAQKIKEELQANLDDIGRKSAAKLQEASALGESERQRILDEAKTSAQSMIKQAQEQISAQTQKALDSARKDIVDLTMLAVQKVIGKSADENTSSKLVEDLLKDIKSK
jgi:F-type H+-transporting ATPase subunit b